MEQSHGLSQYVTVKSNLVLLASHQVGTQYCRRFQILFRSNLPMIAEIADVASCAVLDRMTANIQHFRLRFPFSDASPVVLLVNQLSVKACGQLANSAMMILESGEQISVVSANLL